MTTHVFSPFPDHMVAPVHPDITEPKQVTVSGKTITQHDVHYQTLHAPFIMNYRLDNVKNPLFKDTYNQLLQHHKKPNGDAYRLADVMKYFKQLNPMQVMRDSNRRLKQKGKLSDAELQYFKKMGNNVTLFIHGYNVPYGEFAGKVHAEYVRGVTPFILSPLLANGIPRKATTTKSGITDVNYGTGDFISGPQNTTTAPPDISDFRLYVDDKTKVNVFRDYQELLKRFPQAKSIMTATPDSLYDEQGRVVLNNMELGDDDLNGTGMHNWLLNLEYQLNKAAGFQGFPELVQVSQGETIPYTRLLAIAWQGDPVNPLDYIAMELMAMATAPLVAELITQLHDAGVTVNVLAHSAGNALLTYAMELLGQDNKTNYINNAFMWEAAMPNTALSNDPKADTSLRQHWQTINAYKAVETMHVLYSEHDNVLGKIPVIEGKVDSKLKEKCETAGGGLSDAIEAYFIDVLDTLGLPNPIQSSYQFSQQIGYPLDNLLFDAQGRQWCYDKWLTQNQDLSSDNRFLGRAAFGATLNEQQQRLSTHFNDATQQTFDGAAALMGLLHALTHGHDAIGVALDYLAHSQNRERLKSLMKLLDAVDIDRFGATLADRYDKLIPEVITRSFLLFIADTAYVVESLAKDFVGFYTTARSSVFGAMHWVWGIAKQLCWLTLDSFSIEWVYHDLFKAVKWIINALLQVGDGISGDMDKKLRDMLGGMRQIVMPILTNFLQQGQFQDKLDGVIGIEQQVKQSIQVGEEMATILVTVMSTPGAGQTQAMGYTGPDLNDDSQRKMFTTNQLKVASGTKWLFHHSAMHYPSEDVFKQLYQGAIMSVEASPSYHFGQYPKQG